MRVTTHDHRPATATVETSARRNNGNVLVIRDDQSHTVLMGLPVEHVTHNILTTVVDHDSALMISDDLSQNGM